MLVHSVRTLHVRVYYKGIHSRCRSPQKLKIAGDPNFMALWGRGGGGKVRHFMLQKATKMSLCNVWLAKIDFNKKKLAYIKKM